MKFEEQWARVTKSAQQLKVFTILELQKHSGENKGAAQKFRRTKRREIGAVKAIGAINASKYQIKEQFDEQVTA